MKEDHVLDSELCSGEGLGCGGCVNEAFSRTGQSIIII